MCNQQRLRPACAYMQSDQSPCSLLEYSMSVKLLTEHHLECLSLKGGCTGSYESTLVKMPHCWKSRHVSYVSLFFKAPHCYCVIEKKWDFHKFSMGSCKFQTQEVCTSWICKLIEALCFQLVQTSITFLITCISTRRAIAGTSAIMLLLTLHAWHRPS